MDIKTNRSIAIDKLFVATYCERGQFSYFYRVVGLIGKTQALVRRVKPIYSEYHDDGCGQNGCFRVDIAETIKNDNYDYPAKKVVISEDAYGMKFKVDDYFTKARLYRGEMIDFLSD